MNENKGTEIKRSSKAENILPQINSKTKLGDLRILYNSFIKVLFHKTFNFRLVFYNLY